jgi:cardiolipin synthase
MIVILLSSKAEDIMTKTAVLLLMVLGALGGCTMGTSEPVLVESTLVSGISTTDTPVLLAEQAYQDDNRLLIQIERDGRPGYFSATLPSDTTANTNLFDRLITQRDRPPVAPLLEASQQPWPHPPASALSLPIAGVVSWHEFRDRLCTTITPHKPGTGAVVDFLQQDELFYYYDDQGLLQSVPVYEKPANLRIADTYRFNELLAHATPVLGEYIAAASGGASPAVLFNTGDGTDYGYPFVYANQRTGRVIFLRRLPPDTPPDAGQLPSDAKAQMLVHATFSQMGSTLMQPVGSLARLFSLVTHKTKDTLTYKPLALLQNQPVPPVAEQPPMDPAQWEHELALLVESPVSQGRVRYLVDGEAFFARLIDSIQSAQESIDIRLYIFDNDDYALKIADLLKRRSHQVKVRVLIDGLGTLGASGASSASAPQTYRPPDSIVNYLESDSEVEVRALRNPWLAGDHTKTIVIDRRIGFLGGMNIGREYRYDWHDLMVELRGPIVDVLHTEFERSWLHEGFLGDLRASMYRPDSPRNMSQADDVAIRVLQTMPGDSQILRTQLAAIGRAQQRIYIENVYFTSDAMLYELVKARRRGVDVRVIIPYRGDSGIINRSNILAANAMLANGIRVYIYPGTSHMKGALYDGWLCLGSANFDDLSLRVNKELNIATADPTTVQAFLDQVLLPDFNKSVELKEPFPQKWTDYLMELMADHL